MSDSSTDPVLSASSVRKTYGRQVAVDGVALTVSPGRIHGLLGPNGSGKTTTLHIVTGLVRPDSGSVRIVDVEISDKRSRSLFGFAPDDLPLPGTLTGAEYLRFHDSLRSRNDAPRAALFCEALGIADDLDKLVSEYSHGMQRKIQLVAAVMHNPRLLILDEPFRGLDPEAASTLRSLILTFAEQGGAVLIATHDMLRAERDCDTVTVLHHGSVISEGAPSTLIAASTGCSTLEDVFMRVTGRDVDLARRSLQVQQALLHS